MSSQPKPYTLEVSSDFLDWVSNRVNTARIIPDLNHPAGKEWDYGIPTSVVEPLVEHWKTKYDWKKVEKRINDTFKMFTIDLEEDDQVISLHFAHHRSERPGAIPLIFAHGWPGNFIEVESILQLTDPGGSEAQAFHIVAPSIPGFTLSSSPTKPGFGLKKIASVYHKLMLRLGYETYVGQGGDWGSFILRALALHYPSHLIGLHINLPVTLPPSPFRNPLTLFYLATRQFTPEEKKRLLAWIREKVELATEEDFVWDPDMIITWTMLYLISGSAGHARIYKEANSDTDGTAAILGAKISKEVGLGVSSFPKDIGYATRWWADATMAENIVTWREHEKGGHFPSVECPDALIEDVQEWIKAQNSKSFSLFRKTSFRTESQSTGHLKSAC
ncbi:epoxide hydrolase domain-containing protein [Gymnopus androsaceus JB14]|uniref:Epoxide hydrolase domain-containing protein n=1 Tax=Gymnopus androsaceus JB14 TaxID=1447944 RepID=A0A6A4IKU9_9AGAR|nr:epoxide hydrolase domain-containing protein [Gymnopus androsaceus JB14]